MTKGENGQQTTSRLLSLVHYWLEYLPYAAVISSIIVLLGLWFLGKTSLFPFALTLLIPVMGVSLLYIWKSKQLYSSDKSPEWFSVKQSTLMKIYGIVYCIMIIYLLIVSSRDAVYIFLLVLLYALAISQALLKKYNGFAVVIQVLLTTILPILTKYFTYFYFMQGGDILVHTLFSESIVLNGYINGDIFGAYESFAMLHIINALSSILSSLSIETAHPIFVSIPLLLTSIFVYLISKSLTPSKRIAVFSVFFYLMVPIVLSYTTNAAPRTLSTVAFMMILFLFLRRKENNDRVNLMFLICTAILTTYMILAHHAQLILHFGVMFVVAASYLLYYRSFSKTQRNILILFFSIPILYYLFTYIGNLIGILKTNFFGVLSSTDITETAEVKSAYFGVENFLILSISVLMLIVILLGLYYITNQNNKWKKSYLLWPITLVMFALFTPGVADAFPIISSMEQIGRLQIVLAPLFAVVMAIGFLILGCIIAKGFNLPKIAPAVMLVFCVLVVVASPVITSSKDSSLFYGTDLYSESVAFSNSEIASFTFVEQSVPPTSNIYSDYQSIRYFSSQPSVQSLGKPYYSFPAGTLELFTEEDGVLSKNGWFIFQHEMYITSGLRITPYGGNNVGKDAEYLKYDDLELEFLNLQRNTHHMNTIYSTDGIVILL